MTDEVPKEAEPTTGTSENSSGERSEPRENETPDETKSTTAVSEESSGERSEPRENETPDETKSTTAVSEESSGERSEPRDDEATEESDSSEVEIESTTADGSEPEQPTDEPADDIPLTIAGHEDRSPPGEEDDDPAEADAEQSVAANGGTAAIETGTPSTEAAPVEEADLLADEIAAENGHDPDAAGGDSDDDDEEVEPIELLVQLAKDGEIDPWDVDVVEVTEEFLAALDEGSLRESGRALFYASVLVRMKSDVLLDPEQAEQEAEDPWDAPMAAQEDAPPAFDPVDSLEDEMERRLQRKHVRGTPETLDELVRELREAERGSWWKEGREYDTSGSPAGFDRGMQTVDYHANDDRRLEGEPTAAEVTERTHGEDIEEVIDEVRAELQEHYDAGRPEVLFREIEDAGGSRVHSFLAVLFLANRGEIRLQQDELFGDLWIQDPTAELGAEGAVAD
jgi:segregation and condensation protein A